MDNNRPAFGNLAEIFDKALQGTELPDKPVELTEKEKEKQERWFKRQEEQKAAAAKRAAEMAAAKEMRRKAEAEARKNRTDIYDEPKTNYRRDVNRKTSYSETVNGMTREERDQARETEYNTWVAFVDKLVPTAINCCPDDQVNVPIEKYIRDFNNSKKFCFAFGMPIRPTFLLPDKNEPKTKYRAWKRISEDAVVLEFGFQIPWKRDRKTGERYSDPNGTAQNYFAVKYYDKESGDFKSSLFMYERVEGEFEVMKNKLNAFFNNVVPENKKRFTDFKMFLDKKTRGSFSGKLDPETLGAISQFLRDGGTSLNAKNIHLKTGANCILFDPNGIYLLANMSHHRAGVIHAQEALDNKANGFYASNGKIGLRIPGHMAVIEFLENKVTFVYGA